MIGTTLLHYRIVDRLGSGGMGEVFLARDTKLDRDVAIKVSEDLNADPARLARFEREAKSLAGLNHPNIATLHGFEDDDGARFLVMELVEGHTLAELIREEGPLDPRKALEITAQVASALATAHAAGVIHRDIKPANVMLTPEGRVKVLDFGLARVTRDEDAALVDPEGPTALQATRAGTILGTASYMSPEQARGLELDERSDIWSLGCVLFELLSGRRAFAGETTSDVLAAVARDEPDWSLLPPGLPPELLRILKRMLHKEPAKRLRDAGDLELSIEDLFDVDASDARSPIESTSVEGARRSGDRMLTGRLLVGAAGLLLGALLTIALWPRIGDPPRDAGIRRFTIPIEGSLVDSGRPVMALSPDGTQLAYLATDDDGERKIWLRPLDDFEARPLAAAPRVDSLFWSADGQWIGIVDLDEDLRRVPIDGGPSTKITDLIDFQGANWTTEGPVLLTDNRGLIRVELDGEIEVLDASDREWFFPQQLEDGSILGTSVDSSGLHVAHRSVAGRKTVLLRDAFFGQVVEGDVLVFARPSSVYAASFDAVSLEVGEPRLVLESVATGGPGFPSADLSVADNGTAAWVSAVRSGGSQLMAIDRDGQVESLPAASSELFMPRASPDGRFVTYSTLRDGDFEIWRLDLNRGTASPWLTEGSTLGLVWSPDGERVAYSSLRDGVGRLYVRPVLGSEEVALHSFADGTVAIPTSWGSDGRILLLHIATGSSEDIYAIPASGGELVPIFESDDHEQAAVLSPRGRLLAWVSDRRILVKPLAGDATAPTVVTNHGRMPRWSRDGRSLFFLTGDRSSRMMIVDVDTPEDGDLPVLSAPRELFDHEFGGNGVGGGMHRYDILPDGRFVFVTPPVERASVVNVQLGWLDEVEARLAER